MKTLLLTALGYSKTKVLRRQLTKTLTLLVVAFVACDSELACLYQIQDGTIQVPVGARITFVEAGPKQEMSGVSITLPAVGESNE